MLTLNYRDSRPIYGQIKDGLRRMIVSGALEPGEKLPSIRAMAVDLAINPNTIQRAYAELEMEGFIYSVPGKGSFAAKDTDAARVRAASQEREAELIRRLREIVAELRYLGMKEEDIIAMMNEGVAQ